MLECLKGGLLLVHSSETWLYRDEYVGIALVIGYGWMDRFQFFLLPTTNRRAWELAQPTYHADNSSSFSLRIRRPDREANHWLSIVVRFGKRCSFPPRPQNSRDLERGATSFFGCKEIHLLCCSGACSVKQSFYSVLSWQEVFRHETCFVKASWLHASIACGKNRVYPSLDSP
jgi:hypothetical protein